jgi:hypothetical protein
MHSNLVLEKLSLAQIIGKGYEEKQAFDLVKKCC